MFIPESRVTRILWIFLYIKKKFRRFFFQLFFRQTFFIYFNNRHTIDQKKILKIALKEECLYLTLIRDSPTSDLCMYKDFDWKPKTFFCRLDCRSSRKLNPPDAYSFYMLGNDKVRCLFKLVEIGLSLFACRKKSKKSYVIID